VRALPVADGAVAGPASGGRRNLYLWAFLLGVVVLTLMRPCLRRVPAPPPVRGTLPGFTFVDDAVRATIASLTRETKELVYNVGGGHLYQGRFKSFPVQEDEHFLTVCRYVERNPLRANLVSRAELWKWSSLWTWNRAAPTVPLARWPVPRPTDWIEHVNAPQTEAELNAIRRSVVRSRPFGEAEWTLKTAKSLGHQIKVETQGGVVTLRGKVASAEERTAAEGIARGLAGVTSVSTALQVVPEEQRKSVDAKDDGIAQAVKVRLDKDKYLKNADIKVRSDNSVVTLIGKVRDHKTRARASDVTGGVPGVRAVRNELAQKG